MPADPYKYFRIEANELLGQLNEATLAIEKRGANAELVGKLLRYAHTLKGAARVVKQISVADAAHAVEELLAPHRERPETWPNGHSDRVLKQLDTMAGLLKQLDTPLLEADQKPANVQTLSTADERPRTLRTDVAEIDAVLDGLGEAASELATLRAGLDGDLDQLRQLLDLNLRQLIAPRRQDARQLERALERSRALAEEMLNVLRALDSRLLPGMDRTTRELAEVRATTERLRLVPANAMFTALERAVRDAGRELEKTVTFETAGGEIRLDGAVLELVQGALFHVVRNAVAHGLESARERQARGKPTAGVVRLEVARRGRRVAFVCSDDGRGLNSAAVREALNRQALHAAKRGARGDELGDAELLELLVHSGISTAAQVTGVSGRGVGLDVLREAAERLGGEVQLQSEPGRGFKVELIVPVSVASLVGLVVESSGTTAALPMDSVVQCRRLQSDEIGKTADGESVLHDGKVIPFVPLARSLRVREATQQPGIRSAVIVRGASGQSLAVGVDRVLGTRMVVLRRLPPLAAATSVIAGAALNASGRPELVLDPDGLVASAIGLRPVRSTETITTKRLLVVDDSLTTRTLEQSILESAGYSVDVAVSGEEGLAKLRLQAYGLILVDVEMPGIDGFTFIERLRADPELRTIPAVLVSSRCEPEDLQRGQAVGAAGYVVKSSFDQRELLALIRRLFGGLMSKLRVLVVEDSLTIRKRLVEVLSSDQQFDVVGEAADGQQAIELCTALRPDVITMDMMLPRVTGLAATEHIMAHCPTPILIVSASFNRGELFSTYDALAAGATDVFEKPRGDEHDGDWERGFLSALRLVSRVHVITHPRARLSRLARPRAESVTLGGANDKAMIVAIGTSTGGPNALVDVLSALPRKYAPPILIVMHLNAAFAPMFADWLKAQTGRDVAYARDGEMLDRLAGCVRMAPADVHLAVSGGSLRLLDAPERHSCKPSVDVLFETLAREHAAQVVACLLTGMGRDGAAGLLALRRAGARTIAQDEQSCVVYGMPREAAQLGAAEQILALPKIGSTLAALAANGANCA